MHPIDAWADPVSLLLAAGLSTWVGFAFSRAWRDERRARDEVRAANRQAEALEALRRLHAP